MEETAITTTPHELYPEIEPYNSGYMVVGDGHSIYWEECGNPKGKAVVFVHGGPGGGTEAKQRRFFDPRKYRIILFDQRGCGKSKPFASTKHNTTADLVEDIRRLLVHLGLKRVVLFGGSWGSSLALAYALKYPKTVSGLLFRGVFLCDDEDLRDFFEGGVANHFPEAYERFIRCVPKSHRSTWPRIVRFYLGRMTVIRPR